VVLGGQLRFTSQTLKVGDETTLETTSVSVLPRIEYVFSNQGTRPFLMGFFGLTNTKSTAFGSDTSDSRTLFGVGFGAHLFAAPSFSIDPLLTVARYGGSTVISEDTEFDVSGTLFLISVSLTGWFGGTAPPAAPASAAAADGSAGDSLSAATPASTPLDDEMSGPEPVKTNLLLVGDRVLLLKGRPESLRSAVMFRISDAPNGEALATCRDITVVSGDARHPARNLRLLGSRLIQRERRSLAEGLFSADALDALTDSAEAALVVCGDRWVLTDAARSGLTTFLAEFRLRGGAAKTPSAVPAPAQPPPVAPPPGESQPPPATSTPPSPSPTLPPAAPSSPTPPPPSPSGAPSKATFE